MRIWCGIDWSERHHDVALVDDDGVLIAKRRIPESAAGFRQLLELLAEHGERSDAPIPVAIETAKGLLPAALRAAGYQLFPINPLAVSRYRDRYAVSRAKSDPGDALVLANILRTDLAAHRPLPADSELAGEHPGAGPRPAGRGLGSPAGGEQAAFAAARVLPDPAGHLRRPDQLATPAPRWAWRPPRPRPASCAARRCGRR